MPTDKHASSDFRQRRALQRLSQGFDSLDDSPASDDFSIGVELPTDKLWDGKPVYRKVITFGALPNTATKAVAHGIANVTRFVQLYGWTVRPADLMHAAVPNGA